jgi:hypothetical protein
MEVALRVVVALLTLAAFSAVDAQVCPDTGLHYVVRDQSGKALDETQLAAVLEQSPKPVGADVRAMVGAVSRSQDGRYWPSWANGTRVAVLDFLGHEGGALCSVQVAEITLNYERHRMRLIFGAALSGVPGSAANDYPPKPPYHVVIESLPFQDGTFRLDLARWLATFRHWGDWGPGYPAVPAEYWTPSASADP